MQAGARAELPKPTEESGMLRPGSLRINPSATWSLSFNLPLFRMDFQLLRTPPRPERAGPEALCWWRENRGPGLWGGDLTVPGPNELYGTEQSHMPLARPHGPENCPLSRGEKHPTTGQPSSLSESVILTSAQANNGCISQGSPEKQNQQEIRHRSLQLQTYGYAEEISTGIGSCSSGGGVP